VTTLRRAILIVLYLWGVATVLAGVTSQDPMGLVIGYVLTVSALVTLLTLEGKNQRTR